MKKKLQVFISSTYIDMIEERQAAVTAVLNAGHIPAGMELFKSGDQSQKETIKRWIDESDVYMLILGSRYGSIDPESGRSYTHWEYDYAGQQGKRRFAIVIKDEMEKAKTSPEYLEREHFTEYQDFKKEVLNNISKFYEDSKDIRLIVMESLKDYEEDENLRGWVRADNLNNHTMLIEENNKLIKENSKLKESLEKEKYRVKTNELINGYDFSELKKTLSEINVSIMNESEQFFERPLLKVFIGFSDTFNVGISNLSTTIKIELMLIFEVVPKLLTFGLMEKVKVPGDRYQKYQTSKEGLKFQALLKIEEQKEQARKV
ncbi:hypothetical protein GMA19_01533 [Paenibacillus polymyxa E681]|uniref:DUF4062 domain-containing protein n=1 Tax=Paenibacillus polymyxa TaxID=1406 RepID=UPI0001E317AA|nr:DUF4062 domain-containing protein [Paenibacillus polymyxa]ADM69360.1 hypothetical protein PPE_01521 [Paenibacillus polymyxa E681]QNV56372.1 hypothetical protein GE561_01533 [Paenibacillus polymyxa E681]QNV61209.1 hypothetical protein GMA19_01533 [Paenibacillus polymyxa E681]